MTRGRQRREKGFITSNMICGTWV